MRDASVSAITKAAAMITGKSLVRIRRGDYKEVCRQEVGS